MNQELLARLRQITDEERAILAGDATVRRSLYTTRHEFVIDSARLLEKGKLIEIRPHTRFVHFPRHRHNYVELIYMCSGSTTHIINTRSELTLKEDELLFLPQGTSHSVSAAGYHDISVSFAILPAFLQYPLSMLREDTLLRRFILQVSENDKTECEFLHFHLQDMPEAKNLLENMTRILLKRRRNSRQILQATMGCCFWTCQAGPTRSR